MLDDVHSISLLTLMEIVGPVVLAIGLLYGIVRTRRSRAARLATGSPGALDVPVWWLDHTGHLGYEQHAQSGAARPTAWLGRQDSNLCIRNQNSLAARTVRASFAPLSAL
jgi:hypothetical protein